MRQQKRNTRFASVPFPLAYIPNRRLRRKEENCIAIFHCPIQIIKRSVGRSAIAAAAYRSGEKLTSEWDGLTRDYTHKPGVVHSEIMLPAHAPPEFADRSTLWNSVEQIEKASDAQLAREIEVALPVELSRAAQLALVRSFVKDNFVAEGMCADFALHDKGDGNPHAHILLTIRPIKSDGRWGPKCRKVYDLDSQGNRIPDGKGGWKNHREDTTDWNNRDNAEKWRAAWATYANRALEAAGRPERIDHRSYERQGIDKIPSIHMGVAASQMVRSVKKSNPGSGVWLLFCVWGFAGIAGGRFIIKAGESFGCVQHVNIGNLFAAADIVKHDNPIVIQVHGIYKRVDNPPPKFHVEQVPLAERFQPYDNIRFSVADFVCNAQL